jgi:hypothetical protein
MKTKKLVAHKQRKINPKSLKNLKGNEFKKGESANPGGRPKGLMEFRTAWNQVATNEDMLAFARTLKTIFTWDVAEMCVETEKGTLAIDKTAASMWQFAVQTVLERNFGKVTQPLSNPDGTPLVFATALPKLKSNANS